MRIQRQRQRQRTTLPGTSRRVIAGLAVLTIVGIALLVDPTAVLVSKSQADDLEPPGSSPLQLAGDITDAVDQKDQTFERDSKALAKQIRNTTGGERTELQQKLRRLIDQHFDYRQTNRTAEIAKLEQRIEDLKRANQSRQQNRSKVIDRRFKDLTEREADWTDSVDSNLETAGRTSPVNDEIPNTSGAISENSDPAWHQLGLRLAVLPANERSQISKTKYRGGLRVVEVKTDSAAATNGIQKGDILVGLDKWETVSFDNLNWILTQLATQLDSGKTDGNVKFYIVRGEQMRYGFLPIPGHVTYNGNTPSTLKTSKAIYRTISLEGWLTVLDTERDAKQLGEALEAIRMVKTDADDEMVADKTFQMLRPRPIGGDGPLIDSAIMVLGTVKPRIVIHHLIAELDDSTTKGPQPAIKLFLTEFLRLEARLDQRKHFSGLISEEAAISLRDELRLRSRRIIQLFTTTMTRHPGSKDWGVGCVNDFLLTTGYRVKSFPDLIPIVESIFNDPKSPQRSTAADVLAKSGLQDAAVLKYSDQIIRDSIKVSQNTIEFKHAARRIGWMYSSSPEVASRIREYADEPRRPEMFHTVFEEIAAGLADRGYASLSGVPLLTQFKDQNEKAYGTNFSRHMELAIREIESSKPEPQLEPPAEDAATDPPKSDAKKLDVIASDEVLPPLEPEPTYDGTPYSQWLKILETERKPEKLVAAMDACSRLARPSDESRIARGIFQAGRLFETGNDAAERSQVWENGWGAMTRLRPATVRDEFLASLRDRANYKDRHGFQTWFLFAHTSSTFYTSLQIPANEVIEQLLQLVTAGDQDQEELLAAASAVWAVSSDVDVQLATTLKSQLMKFIDGGPHDRVLQNRTRSLWRIVATNLVLRANEVPDLAKVLLKHSKSDPSAVQLIGNMGPLAEPVVPDLVEMFLEEWKAWQNERREELFERAAKFDRDRATKSQLRHLSRINLIKALGQIHSGEKGYELLRQLKLIAIPASLIGNQTQETDLFNAVDQSLKQFKDSSAFHRLPMLPDDALIHGFWKLKSAHPKLFADDSSAVIRPPFWSMYANRKGNVIQHVDGMLNMSALELDDKKPFKEITLVSTSERDADGRLSSYKTLTRQLGLYQLTETTLRLQLAKTGDPRPTEMVDDAAKLPDGQFLLEFERVISE